LTISELEASRNDFDLKKETLTYYDLLFPDGSTNQQTIDSELFNVTLRSAYARCDSSWDYESCQTLGNLCVLQLYDMNSRSCEAYLSLENNHPNVLDEYED
jgi:hypothetical protein